MDKAASRSGAAFADVAGEVGMESYITIEGPARADLVEKRSRFIGDIRPVQSEQDFAAFLAEIRAAHHDARHHCSAFVLRGGNILRYSDDGEPQGTAGKPILEVLRREGLEDCAIVVTRYFGGILLGAGGLTRAYAATAKLAVDAAKRVEICRCIDFTLPLPYPLYDRITLLLAEYGVTVLDTVYGAEVTISGRIRAGGLDALAARLAEFSGGILAPENFQETFSPIAEPPAAI